MVALYIKNKQTQPGSEKVMQYILSIKSGLMVKELDL